MGTPTGSPTERKGLRGIGGGASLVPLVILFGLNAVDELDRTAFGLLLPEIRDEFGLDLTGITLLAAAIVPAALLIGIPVARLADRSRRIPIAVVGAACWGTFSLLTGIVPTLLLLGAVRVGSGMGRAVNDPVHGSLLSDYYAPEVRAKVFGAHRAANTVGAFMGPIIAGQIASRWGWRPPFVVLAIPTFLLLIAAIVLLREPERTGVAISEGVPRLRDAFRVLWSVGTLRWVWLAFPFISFVAIGLGPLFSLYYSDVFDVGVAARGNIQAFDAPFIVLGLVVGTPLIDRGIRRDPGMVMRRIGMAASIIAVFIFGAAVAPHVAVGVMFSYSINALAIVLYAGGFAVVSLTAPPEARASAFAFFNISALFGILALPMVGIIGDAVGIRWGIASLTPVLFLGSAVLARAGRYASEDVARVNPGPASVGVDPPIPPSPPGPAE